MYNGSIVLEGLLVDLVPLGLPFKPYVRGWLNGPMRDWWREDGLLSQAAFEQIAADTHESPDTICFGMCRKDGTPVGMIHLMNLDAYHRTSEIGAGIGDPANWGGGLGSDATLLIVEYAFRWLDLRRVWLTTMATNGRAQRQVEKCGFTREGCRRHSTYYGGRFGDHIVYGLLRDEWPGRDVMIERLGLREKSGRIES